MAPVAPAGNGQAIACPVAVEGEGLTVDTVTEQIQAVGTLQPNEAVTVVPAMCR